MVSKDKVRELINNYSAEKFAMVVKLCCAPAIFADADKTVLVEFEKDAKQKVRILGVVTNLPGVNGSTAPLLVADIDLGGKELTERSSRTRQFKIARKTLEALFANPPVPVKGFLTQGIFAFHDGNGHFRVSLVTATAENGAFKWSSAKRQSFYVAPDPNGNATFVQRMTMDWSSLAAIKEAFSVERLTKQFYNEIQNWYFWAQLEDQHVSFPNDISNGKDNAKFNGENLIRLITRMVFTWFLKEKGLVNPQLFDTAFLKETLVKFDPEAGVENLSAADLKWKCNYYRAIVQNLFFATFNQEIECREFIDDSCNDKRRHGVKTYYRNAKLFAEKDPKKILAIFKNSPFVNGGLFECLDNVVQKDRETGFEKTYCWDGFSNYLYSDGHDNENRKLKSAIIPNRLFFCDETTCDLSSVLEAKSAKRVKVRGLIRILESYNFTIEENSPSDEEVALDPELLGKVFENLLGCINPETRQMARNSTGSFYTPREQVNYMVGESLVAYLKRALKGIPESEIRQLVAGGAELDDLPTIKARVKDVLAALFRMKILDPACGSGAFPMGAMLAIVEMLRMLDPDNKLWRKVVIDESKKAIAEIDDEEERTAVLSEIEKSFDEKMRYPDYARKLYVIEHCIFGSDIQPIAVQISRLRFFISLLCEQKKTDAAADNYGVTPLPNLENNFVAANSLLSIDLSDMRELLKRQNVAKLIRELRETRHRLFLPKTAQQKAALKEKDRKLCDKIDAAAVAAYDEQVTQNIAKYKKELADAKKKRASLSPKELAEPVFDVMVADDLFGGESKVMNAKLTKGKQLDDKISAYEKKIAVIGNLDRKRVLLDNIRRLVKWNPFAFNIAEDFLDPEWMFGVKDGFDIVIANPPYFRYQESHAGEITTLERLPDLQDAKGGKLNAYKLFLAKSLNTLAKKNGFVSHIFQNSFLGDKSALKLRVDVLNNRTLLSIDSFPERDNPKKRVFESVKMSVCIVLIQNVLPSSDHVFALNTWRDKTMGDGFSTTFSKDEIIALSPDEMAIPSIPNESKPIVLKVKPQKNIAVKCLEGELNVSFCKEYFNENSENPEILKGAAIQRYYVTRDLSQGKIEYLDESSYQHDCGKSEKSKHHNDERIAMQGISGVNDRVRLIMCIVSPGIYLANSCNYIIPPDGLNAKYLLALLNSALMNWYFKLFSTNSNVNGYEVDALPLKAVSGAAQDRLISLCDRICSAKVKNVFANTDKLEREIDDIVFDLYGLTKEEREIVKKACEKPVKEDKKEKANGEGVLGKPKRPVIEEEF